MEKDKAKVIEIVGTASERAGSFVGKATVLGKKIASVAAGGVSAGKGMLGLADEDTKPVPEKKSDNTKISTLKSNLAAARRKLANAEKTQSKLESQLKELKTENHSLASELDQVRSGLSETKSRESAVRARAAALESELDDTRRQLEEAPNKSGKTTAVGDDYSKQVAELKSELAVTQRELADTQSQAEKTQSELASQLKDLEAKKESLISDLEEARNKVNKMTSREKQASGQAAKLESELAAVRQELAETQNQAEHAQTELKKQLQDLQAENKSLISEFDQARKEADDAGIRADSVEAQIAALESNVAAVSLKSAETCEEESDIDIGSLQTDYQDEPAIVPTGEEIKPSNETVVIQDDEQIDADVENVEEPEHKPQLESETKVDVEEIKPEPIPEVELTEPVEVTAEDVQAADFKNEVERIIFTKALSDFASADTFARVDAARAIGGIAHELSARVLVAHMADEPSAVVRQECIKALTTLEMAEGLSAVESALTDETASVRLAAVWGLYRLTGTESIPVLTRMLSDKDASVRRRAVTCIGWLGGQISQADNHHSHQVISALVQCLNDPAVKNAALDTLQTVTGKKMSGPRTSPERLIEQWQNWWKAELLG